MPRPAPYSLARNGSRKVNKLKGTPAGQTFMKLGIQGSRTLYCDDARKLEMTRRDCVKWLKDYGIPHTVPRSACTFCPYHSDDEWQRMKTEDPESWNQAVEVDRLIRDKSMRCNQGMRDQMWLHRSCKPLDQIDFQRKGFGLQGQFAFALECEGMCGV